MSCHDEWAHQLKSQTSPPPLFSLFSSPVFISLSLTSPPPCRHFQAAFWDLHWLEQFFKLHLSITLECRRGSPSGIQIQLHFFKFVWMIWCTFNCLIEVFKLTYNERLIVCFCLTTEQRTTQQGQVYFLHTQTGVSTWHDPRVPRYILHRTSKCIHIALV